ncbi:MAG TPA: malto-oligosyltrehalose trehalohydrolase [Stellaceae bacterium]|nr:malto-oligosyltrehalose trehalohydrolase [Stellaceae bacterium]
MGGGVHFRLWAPRCREVVVEIEGLNPAALQPEIGGYFSLWSLPARAGMRYRFRLDRGERAFPDPASRFQPEGPHGPSEIVDPGDFAWTDGAWRGRTREQLVIYEMHVGTFTPDGSWESASRELPALAELGITCLEIMPVADFPGRFGWGYDGVNLFAPTRLYGRPMDFRRFVDRAHALGIAVILDVVYNHFGPNGNYLKLFSAAYFTDRYDNEWGEAINFDGPDSGPAREFFVANAGYWINEYHLDGLRLDATQAIFDRSEDHIIAAVARQVRSAGRGRSTFVVAENEPQHAKLARPAEHGGYGLDALWNDDFHHSAMVALTGHHEAYYSDYRGRPSEFVAAAKHGFLYQGQRYQWQRNARGTPTFDLPAESFVVFLQNHDQIANSGTGERCHALTSPGRLRAMTAYLLLMPGIPMLFQGQEFGASSPFFYFADHESGLSHDVREGRRRSLAQFPSLATSEMRAELADPGGIDTFRRSVIDLGERQRHASIYALHRDLLELRRTDPVLGQRPCRIDGAALTDEAWMLRFFSRSGADRLLIVNLGRDLLLGPAPEPLLAPIEGQAWRLLWSSEAPVYGGSGGPAQDAVGDWLISGQSAAVLTPGSSVTIPEAKNVFHLREANG